MRAIAVKEFRELRRDRRTLAMLFLLPFLFLVVFGYAASFDIKDVPTVVVGPRRGCVAAAAARRVRGRRRTARTATRASARGTAAPRRGGRRRGHAGRRRRGGGAHRRHRALRRPGGAAQPRGAARERRRVGRRRARSPAARRIQVSVLYNPDLRTAVIMIPGLCGIILVFVGTIATALGVVRERQSGTMEQLAVMPFRPRDVFLGKIAPYLLIAAADMVIVVVAGMLLFDVPFRGSVATFALGALLFLFVTARDRGADLERLPDPGTGDAAGGVDHGAAVPAERPLLPSVLDAVGRALDRLPPAPHLVHQGRARGHGARHAHRLALAAARGPGGDGRGRVHRLHAALPPRPRSGRRRDDGGGGRGRAGRGDRRGRSGSDADEPVARAASVGRPGPHGALRLTRGAGRRDAGSSTRRGHRRDRRRRRRQDHPAARARRGGQAERRRRAAAAEAPRRLRRRRLRPVRRPERGREHRVRGRRLRPHRRRARRRARSASSSRRASRAPAPGSPAGSREACARSSPSRWRCSTSPTCSSWTSPPRAWTP